MLEPQPILAVLGFHVAKRRHGAPRGGPKVTQHPQRLRSHELVRHTNGVSREAGEKSMAPPVPFVVVPWNNCHVRFAAARRRHVANTTARGRILTEIISD